MHPECKDVLILGGWSRGLPRSMIVKAGYPLSTMLWGSVMQTDCESHSQEPGNETTATVVLSPVLYPLCWELENEANGM